MIHSKEPHFEYVAGCDGSVWRCPGCAAEDKIPEECKHSFEFSTTRNESAPEKNVMTYYEVAYSVCVKCGEVRRNKI